MLRRASGTARCRRLFHDVRRTHAGVFEHLWPERLRDGRQHVHNAASHLHDVVGLEHGVFCWHHLLPRFAYAGQCFANASVHQRGANFGYCVGKHARKYDKRFDVLRLRRREQHDVAHDVDGCRCFDDDSQRNLRRNVCQCARHAIWLRALRHRIAVWQHGWRFNSNHHHLGSKNFDLSDHIGIDRQLPDAVGLQAVFVNLIDDDELHVVAPIYKIFQRLEWRVGQNLMYEIL